MKEERKKNTIKEGDRENERKKERKKNKITADERRTTSFIRKSYNNI